MRRIRVLALTNHYPSARAPGDTPCIRDQVEALQRLDVEVEVLCLDRARKRRSWLALAARMVAANVRRRRHVVVHAYYGYAGLVARLQLRVPVVVTFRGSDLLSRRNRRIGPLVARLADGVIVMSEEMRRVSGRADARIVPFGVDRARFAPSSKASARAELGLDAAEELVLFPWDPARPEKRFDVARAAVEALRRARPSARLVTLSDAPPESVALHMNACDALVLASDREGAPMAVRGALACGLPVVATDVGDVRAVIGGLAGCRVCAQEPQALARALAEVLARGRRLDGAPFAVRDAARAAEDVLAVYAQVLARRGA
jgi:glycosyltransferase involved in cell wall biosynthesis